MNFLHKMERKFGKYAIHHLTLYIIITYVTGYLLAIMQSVTGANYIGYLSLNPDAILHGQIWRLVTWWLMPPGSLDIFTIIMLIFYYQIGTALERVWGDYFYNLYIFFGLIMTVIGAFLINAIYGPSLFYMADSAGAALISTYYVSLSIFLGFALTFPNQQVLFMFIIPIKMKYLALVDVAFLVYSVVRSSLKLFSLIMILCSLASTIVLLILKQKGPGERRRQREFRRQMNGYGGGSGPAYRGQSGNGNYGGQSYGNRTAAGQGQKVDRSTFGGRQMPVHRCAVCGRTELDDPNLEFRFCSKCNGNYEYCQDHLYNHVHVK